MLGRKEKFGKLAEVEQEGKSGCSSTQRTPFQCNSWRERGGFWVMWESVPAPTRPVQTAPPPPPAPRPPIKDWERQRRRRIEGGWEKNIDGVYPTPRGKTQRLMGKEPWLLLAPPPMLLWVPHFNNLALTLKLCLCQLNIDRGWKVLVPIYDNSLLRIWEEDENHPPS